MEIKTLTTEEREQAQEYIRLLNEDVNTMARLHQIDASLFSLSLQSTQYFSEERMAGLFVAVECYRREAEELLQKGSETHRKLKELKVFGYDY